ncbi:MULTISPECIES: SulP family inorganic anion transporter [Catenuloplanes]|uniref:carbonic anhydrase n=1 Tax=Catenuloplanes niger TaxID=587534 RepID=A0AAE4CQR1_9ACTN|nr:SulP family inorganic anion transporter [Catenuloplanes niger]MDR7321235.1 carbonic anhydrase [Catenuloplanes niger]
MAIFKHLRVSGSVVAQGDGKLPAGDPDPPPAADGAHGPPVTGEPGSTKAWTWRGDFGASLVVVLIAVPLSLGIAVASGAPLVAGLISAVVGGIVGGLIGGSAVQVSGPAAGLTVIVAGLVQAYGWAATCAIVAAAGVLQLLLGLFRVARAALAVSPAVIHGMLAGVGVVIALSQLHIVLGGTPQSSALDNLIELPGQLIRNHTLTVATGLLTLAVLIAWPRLPTRARVIPAPLAAIAAGTGVAAVLGWDVARVDLPADPLGALVTPQWPDGSWTSIAGAVIAVALVASVESLLCAVAVDRLHDGRRVNLDRELAGQGAANLTAGLLGGLPVAGVIVRSTANAKAGARSRRSTVMHGVWVLALALAAAPAIELIPLGALAALLVAIGVQMVNLAHMRGVHQHGELPVYLLTMAGVVALGLFEGVLIGLGCALLLTIRRLASIHVRVTPELDGSVRVAVDGSLTFLSVPALTRALTAVPARAVVDLSLNIDFMDHAGVTAIDDWRTGYERAGGTVRIDEMLEQWYAPGKSGLPRPVRRTPPVRNRAAWHPLATTLSGRRQLEEGTEEYQSKVAPLVRPLLSELAHGQRPTQLFITCADSRLVPNMITSSGPGDLFTVRNVGNLVPRHGEADPNDSTIAAIEYALAVLPIRTITVCGHSACGAMDALLTPGSAGNMPYLSGWLRHGSHSLDRLSSRPDGPDRLDRLGRENVLQQLENLRTHPAVAAREAAGELELCGGYFDIAEGRLHILSPAAPVTV